MAPSAESPEPTRQVWIVQRCAFDVQSKAGFCHQSTEEVVEVALEVPVEELSSDTCEELDTTERQKIAPRPDDAFQNGPNEVDW